MLVRVGCKISKRDLQVGRNQLETKGMRGQVKMRKTSEKKASD